MARERNQGLVLSTIRIALGVARLGDVDLFGWWQSRGFTDAGTYVLGQSLPRTWTLTALEGAVLSAALRHAQALDRRTAIHLFSDELSAKRMTLNWLRERKLEGTGHVLVEELRRWTRDTACRELAGWVGVHPIPGEILGDGRRLGSISATELADRARCEEVIRLLGAAYTDQAGPQLRLPYFDLRP